MNIQSYRKLWFKHKNAKQNANLGRIAMLWILTINKESTDLYTYWMIMPVFSFEKKILLVNWELVFEESISFSTCEQHIRKQIIVRNAGKYRAQITITGVILLAVSVLSDITVFFRDGTRLLKNHKVSETHAEIARFVRQQTRITRCTESDKNAFERHQHWP
jgi:hypothetical protein